jgi:plasmid replication initiation protein
MDIEVQKGMMVYKAKEINDACCRLSNDAYKLVLLYISMIKPDDDPEKEKSILLRDYCLITEENEYTMRNKIHDLCVEIQNNSLSFRKANGDFIIVNWFSSAEWNDEEKKIILTSHKKVKPFLFDLKKRLDAIYGTEVEQTLEMTENTSGKYISYPYGRLANIKGKYTIRFYEILKPFRKIGYLKINLNELRMMIGAFKGTIEYDGNGDVKKTPKFIYPAYANFKQSIIDIVQKEMEEKTDIIFTFETFKKGKKVISIKFIISENKDAPSFVKQGLLFNDNGDTCPPPDDFEKDIIEKPDLKPKPTFRPNIKPTKSAPATKDDISEIPQELVNMIPKEQWGTHVGCKKIIEQAMEEKGVEAVKYYIDYVIERAKKGKADSYGAVIREAYARDAWEGVVEDIKNKKAAQEKYYSKMMNTCRALSDYELQKTAAENTKYTKYAQAVLKEGRGEEIKKKTAAEKQGNMEHELLDKMIENLETDLDMQKMFVEYMVSRKKELGKVQRQSFNRQVQAGTQISIWVRRKFYSDFIASLDYKEDTKGQSGYDTSDAGLEKAKKRIDEFPKDYDKTASDSKPADLNDPQEGIEEAKQQLTDLFEKSTPEQREILKSMFSAEKMDLASKIIDELSQREK